MFLRVYLFARVMVGRTFSGGASVIGMFANFPFNSFFGIRAIIETDALVTLGKAIVVLIFCMAYCLHVCERAFVFDAGTWNQSFTGAVWMSFLTAATIGYGDTVRPQVSSATALYSSHSSFRSCSLSSFHLLSFVRSTH
jgi:hypothetical protein